MQKAICYVSKLIAARGILELTDRRLCFQVSSFDASFGMKGVSIDVCTISDVSIECGDFHPRVVVFCGDRRYEFVLSKGRELYDRLKSLIKNPLLAASDRACGDGPAIKLCTDCRKSVSPLYDYCPWCGSRLRRA
jgi:hypothetical protein